MSKFAAKTTVSPEKSRQEIENTLKRYGASGFVFGWEDNRVLIEFKMKDRKIRYAQEMPRRSAFRSQAGFEQATRQRWRSLALLIKGKLDAIENGTVTFEREFFAHIVIPATDKTLYEELQEPLAQAYLTGQTVKLLPAIGETSPSN